MDSYIARLPFKDDNELAICKNAGVAYQKDMSRSVPYNGEYFNKCLGYENQPIATKINAGRVSLVDRHVTKFINVLDVGIGSGEFIRHRAHTYGFDINPRAVEWLKDRDLWRDDFESFTAFTFWDVLEHVPDPAVYLDRIHRGSYLFACLPVFSDLGKIRESKHYRPDEHYYYWTKQGFIDWLGLYGFRLLETRDFETRAGRENILSFAFRRYE